MTTNQEYFLYEKWDVLVLKIQNLSIVLSSDLIFLPFLVPTKGRNDLLLVLTKFIRLLKIQLFNNLIISKMKLRSYEL